MSFTDISAALDARTELLNLPTQWENDNFKPVNGQLYIRPTLMPAGTEQAGIEVNPLEDHSGIYQIDIFAPIDKKKGESMAVADAVATHFKANSTLTFNGVEVTIRNTSRGTGGRDDAWYKIPVFISFFSFTKAR